MEIKTTTLTKIDLTADDVKDIVTNYFKDKGFNIESYYTHITTVYDGGMGDYGTEEFNGISITANKVEKNINI